MSITITVKKDYENQRVDNFLINQLKGVPKSHIYKLIRKRAVRANGKRIKQDYRVQFNDVIQFPDVRTSSKPNYLPPTSKQYSLLKRNILFEDDYLLIINKPMGMAVHAGSHIEVGIIEILRANTSHSYLELVHRLDKGTSGCLMIAKERQTLLKMQQAMQEGLVTKTYLCLVKGHWPQEKTQVALALQKNQLQSGERMVHAQKTGKPALTYFKPISYFENLTLIQATLGTGRTHQIRVHTAFSNHPIAGDQKYGNPLFNKEMRKLELNRMFLHASTLEFHHPIISKNMTITAPLPRDLAHVLNHLKPNF